MYTIKDILRIQVAPALGCTEPGAVALCTAAAGSLLRDKTLESLEVWLSPSIYKNAFAVAIPGTGGAKGIGLAAALGFFAGDPKRKLEVLEPVNADSLRKAQEFVAAGRVSVNLHEGHDRDRPHDPSDHDRKAIQLKGLSQAVRSQLSLESLAAADNPIQLSPEGPAVVLVARVDELVQDHIIAEFLGQPEQVDVQVDVVARRTTAPECPLIFDGRRVELKTVQRGQLVQPAEQEPAGLGPACDRHLRQSAKILSVPSDPTEPRLKKQPGLLQRDSLRHGQSHGAVATQGNPRVLGPIGGLHCDGSDVRDVPRVDEFCHDPGTDRRDAAYSNTLAVVPVAWDSRAASNSLCHRALSCGVTQPANRLGVRPVSSSYRNAAHICRIASESPN